MKFRFSFRSYARYKGSEKNMILILPLGAHCEPGQEMWLGSEGSDQAGLPRGDPQSGGGAAGGKVK